MLTQNIAEINQQIRNLNKQNPTTFRGGAPDSNLTHQLQTYFNLYLPYQQFICNLLQNQNCNTIAVSVEDRDSKDRQNFIGSIFTGIHNSLGLIQNITTLNDLYSLILSKDIDYDNFKDDIKKI